MHDHPRPDHRCPDHRRPGHDRPGRGRPDHRRLGRELDLFDTDPLIGRGLPFWLPAGAAVRHAVEGYVRRAERLAGYRHVHSPIMGKRELYEISGHWAHYREDMFPPMIVGGEEFVLRPSLCPHHALVFRSRPRSHRDLPLRLAELGGMHRAELSGVLGGLSRVRAIQLNDGHVFCAEEDAGREVAAALAMIAEAHRALGVTASGYRLSLRGDGDKYIDDPAMWERAEVILRGALEERGLPYEEAAGEGAFYGPKIDVQITDPAGRESTLSTVQVDLFQPGRFGLEYIGPDQRMRRPVMVHRSVVGSMERLMAHLIEVYGGAFPAWLAPVQVVALPVSDTERHAAGEFVRACEEAGLRAELSGPEDGTLGARIRESRLVPYQAVIGPREAGAGQVSLRLRDGSRREPLPASEVVAWLSREAAPHR
ncbi:threonine--tRNA ligase [Planobispora rosea]|uniref:Threonine--tRNA ligase n=1 Tax=Planobispora rosea TaxID=35762 RepID=A0A8J3S9I6_PLARO|nr:threonine--tRNA ligase [Planobispora rosea]GGS95359.1 threonine--tRNA ligase [Planobispora rosea]GIH87534.1 threonine--tRNA ligase [Planobispora rosea]